MNKYGIGCCQLNAEEQRAYALIENMLTNKKTSCDISSLNRKVDMMMILQTVIGDHPEIIYFNKSAIKTMTGMFSKKISLTGCLGESTAGKLEKELKHKVDEIVWKIDRVSKNDREILLGICTYLQENVVYDNAELAVCMRGRAGNPESHNAVGALIKGKAVCDGFSSAFSLLAQNFGFKCMVVEGKSSYHQSSKVEHAWNIVQFDGKFYHIDSTWDANSHATIKEYSYDYFGLDDDEISVDHDWNYNRTPKCNNNDLSYYYYNKLVAQSESQINDIFLREIRAKNDVIRVKILANIALPSETDKYLGNKFIEVGSRAGMYNAIQYMWNERTRCFFVQIK